MSLRKLTRLLQKSRASTAELTAAIRPATREIRYGYSRIPLPGSCAEGSGVW